MTGQGEVFYPFRRLGLVVQASAAAFLSLLGAAGLGLASAAQGGGAFVLYLLPVVLAAFGVPVLLIWLHALWTGRYTFEQDGIRLQWGYRIEHIPADQVTWVGLLEDYPARLPLPVLHWPGMALGVLRRANGTPIEFLASRVTDLVVIETPTRLYAISPLDPPAVVSAHRRLAEMGAVSPLAALSVYPAFLPEQLQHDRLGRALLLLGATLAAATFGLAALALPGRETVILRAGAVGRVAESIPAVRVLLLPILNLGLFGADWLLGLFFYRQEQQRAAYLLWMTSVLVSVLFMIALVFILRS